MTTEVFIGHMNPGYQKDLEVLYVDDEGKTTARYLVLDGQCRRFFVYANQNIRITEIPKNGGSKS